METAFRTQTVIRPGRRIELDAPPFAEGTPVEVLVTAAPLSSFRYHSALEFLRSLPNGPRAFATWAQYEQHLEAERNAWGS
jgi:hypothetical protein